MSKVKKEVEEQVVEAAQEEQEVEVKAEIHVKILSDGNIAVSTPEGMPELQPIEVEGITRQVHEQLRDMRIASSAVELFKSRL